MTLKHPAFSQPAPSSPARANALRLALDSAFPLMACRKALHLHEGDPENAAQWLTDGNWQTGKLISWNPETLRESATALCKELGVHAALAFQTLKNCSGSVRLARQRILLQPVLSQSEIDTILAA